VRSVFAGVCLSVLTLFGLSSTAGASPFETHDPDVGQQWNLSQVGAFDAWKITTGVGAKIGIVDTGVDASNPELAGKIDALADCVGGTCREGSAKDGNGHGTAVAGIAAARADNSVGTAGVAPGAHLVIARALNDRGIGTTEDINNAIAWVVDHGAQVVNLSLGDNPVVTSRVGTDLSTSIEAAWTRGAIPVLAAGNYEVAFGDNPSASYGNLDAVIVGASDNAGKPAWYSTSIGNAKWGLIAPGGGGEAQGEGVLSPWLGGTYKWLAGTSMATPHVSAALAMLVSQGLTPSAAVQRLLATANTTIPCGDGCHGRLQLDAAVQPIAHAANAPVPRGSPNVASHHREPLGAIGVVLAVVSAGLTYGAIRRTRKRAEP
jgi:thermitase